MLNSAKEVLIPAKVRFFGKVFWTYTKNRKQIKDWLVWMVDDLLITAISCYIITFIITLHQRLDFASEDTEIHEKRNPFRYH